MTINQLSLFLENKPGHLHCICRTLADAGISIVTLSMADTDQFGILRLIIREWEDAKTVLEANGFAVNITPVVATEVEDRPGGMAAILAILENGGINIEYMYAFTGRRGHSAVLIFRFDDPVKAVEVLKAAGRHVIGQPDLFKDMQAGQ